MIKTNIENVKSDFLTKARFLLTKKYNNNLANKYNILKINDILSNSKSHLVSTFKDYLLFDDFSEFIERYYNGKDSKHRIKKISNFFAKELFIYPNYSSIEEGKYVLCSIIKKQMLLNKRRRNIYYLNNERKKIILEKKDNVFNNAIYDDIFGQQKSESFINLLFGLDNKIKENSLKIENNEIEDINKIIKLIESNENLYMQKPKDRIYVNTLFSNKNKNNLNIFRKNLSKTNIRLQEYKTNENNKINKDINNFNEETKDNSKGNSKKIYTKHKLINNSMIYHRKLKSTSLSNNISKLELPSAKNLINILKTSKIRLIEDYKDKKVITEKSNKTKKDKINTNKIPINKINKAKKDVELFNNKIKHTTKRKINKTSRNNQSNINLNNNTLAFFGNNKSIYIKNKVLRNNMSNKNIYETVNDENKEINNRKYSKPYSKPKCIYKENKINAISHKTYYSNLNEVIYIERLK